MLRTGEECLIRPAGYEWCLPDLGVAPGPERIASPKAVVASTRLQVAGHHRGFFFSLRMFANGEVFYWVHISLQNPSHHQFLMKMGRGKREREKEKEWICLEGLELCTVSVGLSQSSCNPIPWARWIPDKLRSYVSMGTAWWEQNGE